MDTSYLVRGMYQLERGEDGKFYNRELAILDFNKRVLGLAYRTKGFEYAKYIDIVYRNLIEFIQVRFPRCKKPQQEICSKFIQDMFDEMEQICNAAPVMASIASNTLIQRDISKLQDEMSFSLSNDGNFCLPITRPVFDLYSYNGETESEMLDEFIKLSSLGENHQPYQETVAELMISLNPDMEEKRAYPTFYVGWNVILTISWYRREKKHSDPEQNFVISGWNQRFSPAWKRIHDSEFPTPSEITCRSILPIVCSSPHRSERFPSLSYDRTVVGAIEYMCALPYVYMICMTLYRTAKESRIVDALISAAKSGKKVLVYVEIMARGNEVTNVELVNRLREAGVTVYHSFGGLKIHAKIFGAFLHGGPDYAILSTGNFNEDTAKVYTDMHYVTREPIYTEAIFNLFSKAISQKDLSSLVGNGPFGSHFIRNEMTLRICREAAYGKEGRIWIKCNSLCDRSIIRHLYSAVIAGADVRIIVRTGIGVGDTSTLPVRSKIGEYLEHERIYIFGDEIFLSSADLMIRNLDRRVESFFQVNVDEEQKRQILTNFIDDWNSINTQEIHWDDSFKADIFADVTDMD